MWRLGKIVLQLSFGTYRLDEDAARLVALL
jgi:hypothetical protein